LPDRYSYDYAGPRVEGTDRQAPVLYCQPFGPVPVPGEMPRAVWRAGLDLNPLDVNDPDDARWLECLLWPGETGRWRRLHDALATARRCTPTIRRGDLVEDLATVAADAPPEATLVVYHTAVLAYVDYDARQAFADKVTELGAVWLANEAPGVIALAGGGRSPTGGFELIRDGTQLLAHTDSHGASLNWHPAQSLRVKPKGGLSSWCASAQCCAMMDPSRSSSNGRSAKMRRMASGSGLPASRPRHICVNPARSAVAREP